MTSYCCHHLLAALNMTECVHVCMCIVPFTGSHAAVCAKTHLLLGQAKNIIGEKLDKDRALFIQLCWLLLGLGDSKHSRHLLCCPGKMWLKCVHVNGSLSDQGTHIWMTGADVLHLFVFNLNTVYYIWSKNRPTSSTQLLLLQADYRHHIIIYNRVFVDQAWFARKELWSYIFHFYFDQWVYSAIQQNS